MNEKQKAALAAKAAKAAQDKAAQATQHANVEAPEYPVFKTEKEADNALLNAVQVAEKARGTWVSYGFSLAHFCGTMEKVEAYCKREETRDAIRRGLPQEMRVLLSVARSDTPKESLKARDAAAAQQSTYLSRVSQYAKDALEGKKKVERTAQDLLDNFAEATARAIKSGEKVKAKDAGNVDLALLTLGFVHTSLVKGVSLKANLIGLVAMLTAKQD